MITVRTHKVAREAYECVAERRDKLGERLWADYAALAHKLPGMVLENGLAQATGFLLAKGHAGGDDQHMALLDDVNRILRATGASERSSGKALHCAVIESDLNGYMILTRRTLEASAWLKRYVQGMPDVGTGGAGP